MIKNLFLRNAVLLLFILTSLVLFTNKVNADETMTYRDMSVVSVDNERDVVRFIADDTDAEPQDIHNVPMSEKIKMQAIVNQKWKSKKRFDVAVSNGNHYVNIIRVADHKNFAQKLYDRMATWQDNINSKNDEAVTLNGTWSFVIVVIVIISICFYRWYFKNPVKTERR